MKRWCRIFAILALVVLPQSVTGQVCQDGETAQACFARLRPTTIPALKQEALREGALAGIEPTLFHPFSDRSLQLFGTTTVALSNEKLALQNTGAQSSAAGQSPSTKDFANDFIGFLESIGAGKRDGDTLTFRLGFPLRAPADQKKLNLSLALKDPKLDPAVAGLLTGKDLDDANNTITRRDGDMTFGAAWAFMRRSVKDPAQLARESGATISSLTTSSLIAQMSNLDVPALREGQKTRFERTLSASPKLENRADIDLVVLTALQDARAEERQFVQESARRSVDLMSRAMADAANEQKQFWGEATYHYRDPLIGAKQVNVSFGYEIPTSRQATDQLIELAKPPSTAEAKSDELRKFMAADTTTAAAKPRFSFTGTYQQVERRTFALPALSTLIKPSSHVVSLAAVAGWKIPTLSGDRNANLDFNGTFENDSSDPKKKNRIIASLTFTQKLTDQLTLPLALVYASHERDLTDVNHRFSAHFGISYKVPPTSSSKQNGALMAAVATE